MLWYGIADDGRGGSWLRIRVTPALPLPVYPPVWHWHTFTHRIARSTTLSTQNPASSRPMQLRASAAAAVVFAFEHSRTGAKEQPATIPSNPIFGPSALCAHTSSFLLLTGSIGHSFASQTTAEEFARYTS